MENRVKHKIKDVTPYLHLVPIAKDETYVLKRVATLKDSIDFILRVIRLTAYQTEHLAKVLNGATLYDTCRVIFNWVYDHVEYRPDQKGKEQVKSPQRTISDQFGDCEDMQVLTCSILYNKKIPFIIRTTVYNWRTGVQHIYPLVIMPNGREVVIDCVTNKFDYEVPYLKKYDYTLPPLLKTKTNMELQFLNGIPDSQSQSIDAEDLLNGNDDFGDLGRRGKGKLRNTIKKIRDSKFAKTVRKGLHVANILNPAAATLRAGILIALKTNLFKVAEHLRFAYLTPEEAQSRGYDMDKYNRLQDVKTNLENSFFRAGGKVENFKKAILNGRGNRSKEVPLAGFGSIDYSDYNPRRSSSQILGIETYSSEFEGIEGFGGLGIAPAVAVAAATSIMTAIAALLKSIGDLKKKKTDEGGGEGGGDSYTDQSGSGESSTPITDSSADSSATNNTVQQTPTRRANPSNSAGDENEDTSASTNSSNDESQTDSGDSGTDTQQDATDSTGESVSSEQSSNSEESGADNMTTSGLGTTTESGFTKAINWVKAHPLPVIGGVIVLAGIGWGLSYYFKKKKEAKKEQKTEQTVQTNVAGLPKKKNKEKIRVHLLR